MNPEGIADQIAMAEAVRATGALALAATTVLDWPFCHHLPRPPRMVTPRPERHLCHRAGTIWCQTAMPDPQAARPEAWEEALADAAAQLRQRDLLDAAMALLGEGGPVLDLSLRGDRRLDLVLDPIWCLRRFGAGEAARVMVSGAVTVAGPVATELTLPPLWRMADRLTLETEPDPQGPVSARFGAGSFEAQGPARWSLALGPRTGSPDIFVLGGPSRLRAITLTLPPLTAAEPVGEFADPLEAYPAR